MRKTNKYIFTTWSNWDDILADAIEDFYSSNLGYPNIILSNEYSYSQIDYITNLDENKSKNAQLLVEDDTNKILSIISAKEANICLTSFSFKGNDIDFAVENKLNDKEFLLVKDDSPDWGFEEGNCPIESTKIKVFC